MNDWKSRYALLRGSDPVSFADIPVAGVVMPDAERRGVISYYAGLHESPGAVKVCRGTSCLLRGANAVYKSLRPHAECCGAFCIGYCDRSPAALLADGTVVVEISPSANAHEITALPAADPVPDIRCVAPVPIVTQRLQTSGSHELVDAVAAGAYSALKMALSDSPGRVLDVLERSGERGRGGAAFPTARKWRLCSQQTALRKFVVANGDEGDPGSFIDRVLLERDPHAILEGLALAAYAVGAQEGVVFIRAEYPLAQHVMSRAIDEATEAGYLGANVFGSTFTFSVRVVGGMGSYVCGEETALLNAIEGLRGEVRVRPPYPVQEGLFGCPTVVDNVETLVNVPWIVNNGAERYAALGTAESSGTKAFSLNHGFARPGIVELEYGVPLRRVIEEFAGGARTGMEHEAVILGGPMGSVLFPDDWDVPVCYGEMARRGIRLGHAGLVAVPKGTDWRVLLRHWLEFMASESCGKCVPCALGSQQALDLVRRAESPDAAQLEALFALMEDASLCAFGRSMPGPMRTLLSRCSSRAGGH
jgi:NADH:ubiquinone oxidoreductase subunit F (NADH-binding)